jgi:hypothetical protein
VWAITNRTPYAAGKTWARDKEGVYEWVVAVKGTFDIKADGKLALADEQPGPLALPEYYGEPGQSSLLYDADLVAPKPTTDVVINATAYAPNGRASTNFLVEARIGSIHKVVRVVGTRTWSDGLMEELSDPEPITQIPVTYESAYGGYDHANPDPANHRMDTRNPVGRGVVAPAGRRAGQAAPNFEYPKGRVESAGPAGFGALDSFWSPRRELNGTYDKAWEQNRRPLVPEDWNSRSLLCSPVDQQPDSYLRGGEAVELINLTPAGRLCFVLPKIYLTFTTHIDGRREEHRSRLSSIIIEPDYPRVMMVWLTSLPCRTNVDYLDETVVREKRYI